MAETITGSVGQGGLNRFADVETIQSLLNQVPPNQGGPEPLLDLDGIVGPLTIDAIRKFQKHHFGWQDGRVDPNNQTLAKLNEFDLDPATGNAVRFVEDHPNDGFEPADPVSGRAPWLMVPLGGSKFVKIPNGSQVALVTSNNEGVARALNFGIAVQIFGVTPGTTLLKARDAHGRVLARLDVSVKRKRTVRTSFFFVEDADGTKTQRTPAAIDPFGAFSGGLDDLIAKANEVFEPQANVTFTKKLVKDPLPFKQEFGDVVRFSRHLPTTGAGAVPASEHEWDTIVAKRDTGADFNMFFVWEYEQDATPDIDNTAAGTIAAQGSCIMEDKTNGPAELVFGHEAGHNLGLDHSTNPGELMFEGVLTNSSRRLTRAQIERINRS